MSTNFSDTTLLGVAVLVIWDLFWKGMALWRAGRHNQATWFIVLLILNSAGILPIVYLIFFQRDKAKE